MIKFIYVMDPQCMWCYAFGKNVLKLYDRYNDRFDFDLLSGGLYIGPDIPEASLQLEQEKRPLAARITKVTSVQFSFSFMRNIIGKSGSNLDSEPPSRILQSVKRIKKDVIIPFMEDLLAIQYLEGKSLNDVQNCFPVLEKYGIDSNEFLNLWDTKEMIQKTADDFIRAGELTQNFPALFAIVNDHPVKIAGGYASFEKLLEKAEELLEK